MLQKILQHFSIHSTVNGYKANSVGMDGMELCTTSDFMQYVNYPLITIKIFAQTKEK